MTTSTTHSQRRPAITAPVAVGPVTSAVSQQGALVGQVIADLARQRRTIAANDGPAILRAVDRVLAGRRSRRSLTGARQAMALFAAAYLRQMMPPAGWLCLGAEIETAGGGRIDLVWRGPGAESEAAVLFDELKAQAMPTSQLLAGPGGAQLDRYLGAGRARFGSRFIGVRLISLRHPADSLLLRADGAVERLGESSPFAEAAR